MGLILTDAAADFSANAVGYINLETSISSGLQTLLATRQDADRALASDYGSAADAVVGTPAFNGVGGVFNTSSYLDTGISLNGDCTVAVVCAIRNGGSTSDWVLRAANIGPTNEGAFYAHLYNRRFTISAYSYASASPPLTTHVAESAFLDFTVDQPEMIVARLEGNVAASVRCPRTSAQSTDTAVGRYFPTDGAPRLTTTKSPSTTTLPNHTIHMIAVWDRALSNAEITTFYNEMKEQMAAYGLTI